MRRKSYTPKQLDHLAMRIDRFRNPPGELLTKCPIWACTNLIAADTGPCAGCRQAFGSMLRPIDQSPDEERRPVTDSDEADVTQR